MKIYATYRSMGLSARKLLAFQKPSALPKSHQAISISDCMLRILLQRHMRAKN